VTLSEPFKFFFMDSLTVTLRASATMRLEQAPTLITGAVSPPGGVCP
jgi:hypothetical protein